MTTMMTAEVERGFIVAFDGEIRECSQTDQLFRHCQYMGTGPAGQLAFNTRTAAERESARCIAAIAAYPPTGPKTADGVPVTRGMPVAGNDHGRLATGTVCVAPRGWGVRVRDGVNWSIGIWRSDVDALRAEMAAEEQAREAAEREHARQCELARDRGVSTDAEALLVAPYDRSYRVDAGVTDWGYAVVCDSDEWRQRMGEEADPGYSVARVRRDWYERPRHQSSYVGILCGPIRLTRELAEADMEALIGACDHDYEIVSHEERVCRKCGAAEFVPDTD